MKKFGMDLMNWGNWKESNMSINYNPRTASIYSKNCSQCNHIRKLEHNDFYFTILDDYPADLSCALSGKYIEFDKNNYPIGCLLRYVGKREGE